MPNVVAGWCLQIYHKLIPTEQQNAQLMFKHLLKVSVLSKWLMINNFIFQWQSNDTCRYEVQLDIFHQWILYIFNS